MLDFDKPKKLRDTKAHNEMYQSDSGVPGTYVPNMSDEDCAKWKAKDIKGANHRIEIRRSSWNNCWCNLLVVVTTDDVTMSMNGKLVMTDDEVRELGMAIKEAQKILVATAVGVEVL